MSAGGAVFALHHSTFGKRNSEAYEVSEAQRVRLMEGESVKLRLRPFAF
jgi:hypothetical protein